MPFHVRDPWRVQYFEGIHCPAHVNIPIDDIDCWDWFPEFREAYDKLHIARSQGVAAGLRDEMPPHFPVFAKPRINLKGMGLGSRVIQTKRDFAAAMTNDKTNDMMWMDLFTGPHLSTDCAVVNGNVAWIRHATGETWNDGMFKHWTIHAEDDRSLSRYISEWVALQLRRYTGMVNIETIGGRIIEVQLRFADQWCDLYGRSWFDAVVNLYDHKGWSLANEDRKLGYSVPLFARHGTVPRYPSLQDQLAIRSMPGVASLQITFHESKRGEEHPMPPGGFRLGLVNSWTLDAGFAARQSLAQAFEGVEVMIPA
jgi:hypothetical protein